MQVVPHFLDQAHVCNDLLTKVRGQRFSEVAEIRRIVNWVRQAATARRHPKYK
jgi:hypothetical protein